MMRNAAFYVLCLVSVLALSACRATRVTLPDTATVHPKPALTKAKKSLTPKAPTRQLPPVLGGLIQSDSWVIYKDKQQEEFVGNVSYDNGAYIFRAGYALSDRKNNTFTARQNVFLKQNNPDGTFYQAEADYARYNYNTQQGALSCAGKKQVRLTYLDENAQTVTALAQRVKIDLNQKIYVLEKDVKITRPTPQGTQVITAQKVTLKQLENYALLEGDAALTDGKRTLTADTILYDGQHNTSYAYGARPLTYGSTEQGTFAVIADKIQSDAQGHVIHLDGQVQGWLVSPQINNSDINTKF